MCKKPRGFAAHGEIGDNCEALMRSRCHYKISPLGVKPWADKFASHPKPWPLVGLVPLNPAH